MTLEELIWPVLYLFRLVYAHPSCSSLLLPQTSVPEDQTGILSVFKAKSFTIDTTHRDTVGQDTTIQSTMDNGLIEAKLISREYCLSHWVITFSQSGKCINADLSKNVIRYSQDPLPEVIRSIGFRIKNGKPPIDELLEDLLLPPQFVEPPRDFCDCVQ